MESGQDGLVLWVWRLHRDLDWQARLYLHDQIRFKALCWLRSTMASEHRRIAINFLPRSNQKFIDFRITSATLVRCALA